MASPFAKVGWNKYEVALLIDAYKNVVSGELARKDAISKLSERLRYRMVSCGVDISDKYRNENGVSLQLAAIEYCLTHGAKGFGNPSRMFWDIADIYSDKQDEFQALLSAAITRYPEPLKRYYRQDDEKQSFVREPKVGDYKIISRIREILRVRFPKGYRVGSAIAGMQIRGYYKNTYGQPLSIEDDELDWLVTISGVAIGGLVYIPEQLIGNDSQRKIGEFIKNTFACGKHFIFYSAILKQFNSDLLYHSHITSVEMLRACLSYRFSEEWHFAEEYLADRADVKVSVDDEVVEYILEQGCVVSESEVVKGLPLIAEDAVRQSFTSNSSVLISNGRGQRFHINIFSISSNEMENIVQIISDGISQFGFISAEELIGDIQQKMPDVKRNNPGISDLGIRNALAMKLDGCFSFNHSIISEAGKNINSADALIAFCRSHEEFTIDEINNLAEAIGTVLISHLDKLYCYSLRIDDSNFVPTKSVRFDVEGVDAVLSTLLHGDYMPIGDVKTFAKFPCAKYPWNSRLLESYLLTNSKSFTLITGRYSRDYVSGAIVRKASKYVELDDIVIDVLAKSDIPLSEENALALLTERGYIVRRSYSGIELLIIKAKELRNKRIRS